MLNKSDTKIFIFNKFFHYHNASKVEGE